MKMNQGVPVRRDLILFETIPSSDNIIDYGRIN